MARCLAALLVLSVRTRAIDRILRVACELRRAVQRTGTVTYVLEQFAPLPSVSCLRHDLSVGVRGAAGVRWTSCIVRVVLSAMRLLVLHVGNKTSLGNSELLMSFLGRETPS